MESQKRKISALKILGVVLTVSLIPILLIGFYCTPGLDDYGCGEYVHLAWKDTHSFLAVIMAAFRQTIRFYNQWQGTFGSSILMSFNPAFFSMKLNFLIPIIMLVCCIGSTLLLFTKIYREFMKCDKELSATVLLMLLISYIQVLESPRDGLFWYNGAIHYIGIQSLFFLVLYLMINLWRTNRKTMAIVLIVVLMPLCFFVGGGNYVTALQAAIVFAGILIYELGAKRKTLCRFVLPMICFYFGFYLNASAPGNTVRGGVLTGLNPIEAVIKSFIFAAGYLIEWLNLIIIITLLLTLPFLWKMVKQAEISFSKPVLVLIGSICLYAAMFTPSLYAGGTAGAGRQLNIIQWMCYLLILFNLTYIMGYIAKNRPSCSDLYNFMEMIVKLFDSKIKIVLVLLICFVMIFTLNKTTFTSISACRSLVNGEAHKYHSEYMERYEILSDPSIPFITVEPLSVYPELLTWGEDFSTDSTDWVNITGSFYFRKTWILLEEKSNK